MKKYFLIIATIILFITSIKAQEGTIRGKVIDENTGDALVGATVIILNTNPTIVTVTDYDGNFSLENIPEGKHTLKCSFMSFQDYVIENLDIITNKVEVIDIILSPAVQNIAQVVVNANAVKNTENSLMVLQKKSISLINGVSAQNISKLGDSDAASAVKRITGVSVENGKYIFIRGLSDRYSKVTLNGAEIPGLDPNRNTVQLDIFSSNIIDNIIIHKTYSADLPASFAGGYVDISTKSFPNEFTMQFSASFGYNPNANLRNDFLSYQGGKLDWLGIDDGSRQIPEQAQTNVPYLYENNDLLDDISASFNKTMQGTEKESFLNQSYSFSIGNQHKIANKPFGYIFDLNYSKNYSYYNNGRYARYNLVEDETQGSMKPLIIQNEKYGEEEIVNSVLLGLSYKFSANNKIGFTFVKNGGGLISSRYREGSKPEDNMFMFQNTLGFQQRLFNSAQINGTHIFGENNKQEMNWTSSFTKSVLSEPDLRFFNYDSITGGSYQISYNAYPSPARFYRDLDEINYDNKIHFISQQKNIKIKFGASYTLKTRNSVSRKFDILSQGLQFDGDISEYLSDENIGQNADATYGVYYQNDPLTDKYNSYYAYEHLAGAYLMGDIPLGDKIDLSLGVRYEFDFTFIQNNVETYHPKYVKAEKIYMFDFMPALNLNYNFIEDFNLRFAYSRTLARPAFREIAPYAYYDFKEAWRVVGNPELERSLIDNVDFRAEKFLKDGQLISVSGFVKYFTKPIELVDDPRANNPELHYVNAKNSFLYGAEIEIRKNLDFVNLKDLLIGGNFTILKSEVRYVEDYGSTNYIITERRPMYGQSPWVLNLFANYENEVLGISTNLGFNVDGPKLSVVTKGSTPDVYQQPCPQLNFNVSKRIIKNISLKFSVNNILNSDYKKTYIYDNQEYIFQNYNLGRTYSVSLKYLIN